LNWKRKPLHLIVKWDRQTSSLFAMLLIAGGTETVAVKQTDGSYKLYGHKWFSSATDADVALTLARISEEHGHCTQVCIFMFLRRGP